MCSSPFGMHRLGVEVLTYLTLHVYVIIFVNEQNETKKIISRTRTITQCAKEKTFYNDTDREDVLCVNPVPFSLSWWSTSYSPNRAFAGCMVPCPLQQQKLREVLSCVRWDALLASAQFSWNMNFLSTYLCMHSTSNLDRSTYFTEYFIHGAAAHRHWAQCMPKKGSSTGCSACHRQEHKQQGKIKSTKLWRRCVLFSVAVYNPDACNVKIPSLKPMLASRLLFAPPLLFSLPLWY